MLERTKWLICPAGMQQGVEHVMQSGRDNHDPNNCQRNTHVMPPLLQRFLPFAAAPECL